jgi:hypothetical protein
MVKPDCLLVYLSIIDDIYASKYIYVYDVNYHLYSCIFIRQIEEKKRGSFDLAVLVITVMKPHILESLYQVPTGCEPIQQKKSAKHFPLAQITCIFAWG